jgi:hypothetical protein
MDLEDLTDEAYFASMKMMFLTDGWKILMQEYKDQADVINDVQDLHTLETLCFAKGQLSAIGKLLNFQDMLLMSEEEANDEGS